MNNVQKDMTFKETVAINISSQGFIQIFVFIFRVNQERNMS